MGAFMFCLSQVAVTSLALGGLKHHGVIKYACLSRSDLPKYCLAPQGPVNKVNTALLRPLHAGSSLPAYITLLPEVFSTTR